ncbi:MAG TPA: hypothetical protein VLF69_00440 [Candidatus Saccharimonadales bacterium]|nr:hypothetical protein [Candidatus Saccharimonadales bacterium]
MVERVEKVTEVKSPAGGSTEPATGQKTARREETTVSVSGSALAARVVWYIAGVLLAVLGLRFVLALLGANPNNEFANFIYSISHPFVAPFFSLFGYDLRYGVSRFETFTLVAMAIYALVAWGIARLVTISKADQDVG